MQFDDAAFFRALDDRRGAENITWRQLGKQLGLSPSTFSRLSRARRPDVHTFLKLLDWLQMPADAFIVGGARPKEPNENALGAISQALRRDPTLRPQDVGAIEDIVRVAYRRFQSAPSSKRGRAARGRRVTKSENRNAR